MSSGNMYFYISVCSTHTSNMFSSPTLSGQLVENLYVQNEKKKEKKNKYLWQEEVFGKEEVEEKKTLPDEIQSRAVPDKLAHVLLRVQQGCCLSLFY